MLLDDLADYLSSGSTGTLGVVGEHIFKGLAPAGAQDAVTVIYETGGQAPVRAMSPGPTSASGFAGVAVVERPRVQVVCRGSEYGYSEARSRAATVFEKLDAMPARSINGVAYKWAAALQSPFLMGRDENRRPMIACNFDVVKELS